MKTVTCSALREEQYQDGERGRWDADTPGAGRFLKCYYSKLIIFTLLKAISILPGHVEYSFPS